MDLKKFEGAFNMLNYDSKTMFEIKLRKLCSIFIITETGDLETASDFIAAILQSNDDCKIINSIIVQEAINEKFKTLLRDKIKPLGELNDVKVLSKKGFEIIGDRIVVCPHNIADNDQIISYEVFRTVKEGIVLAKTSVSVGLWCKNISVAHEIIHSLNAAQIWLNSSFGLTNKNIPFLTNGNEIIWENKKEEKVSAISEVDASVFYQTSFQNEKKFKTIVIPFGETFAN